MANSMMQITRHSNLTDKRLAKKAKAKVMRQGWKNNKVEVLANRYAGYAD